MRQVPATIWNLWDNGGPYFGEDGAPHSRVTVEIDWRLHRASTAGNFKKLPIRWWQREDNTQVETEVPNVRSVEIERSLDTDAATCTIQLSNQWHFTNGEVTRDGELGQPGYFTFSRGDSSEAAARWDQAPNDWNGVLVPNALLRTYQGYGGKDKSVDDAIADGNILLTGVWLIDTVTVRTDGTIGLQCRDMAKLLIDQFIFPPLTPHGWYPLTYCRWYFDRGSTPQVLYGHLAPGEYFRVALTYAASSSDEDGTNDSILGHRPTHALDQNSVTYWLSMGRAGASDWVYYEADVNDRVNAFFIEGVYSGYQVYVSLMEDGVWQGANTVPAPSGYNIAYVYQQGADSSSNAEAILDRIYRAQQVRYTFTNLHRTDLEGITYRVAAEEISLGRIESGLPTKRIMGLATIPNNQGYWLVGNDGGVFSLGRGIQFYGSSGGGGTSVEWTMIKAMPDGTGYYTVRGDGRVYAFGSAVFHGDAHTLSLGGPVVDMGITPSGGGYWLLGADGGIMTYGDAVYYGNGVGTTGHGFALALAERPQGNGYWILWSDGHVQAKGAAVFHGDANVSTTATGITSTKSGNGYWVVSEEGSVFAFGDAGYHGGANNLTLNDTITDITRSSTTAGAGYLLVGGDGGVFTYGDAYFWGSLPSDFSWAVRKQGNYKDYTDIIKDLLLWSGWFLYDPALPGSTAPSVFGNLETTGVFDSSLSSGVGAAGTGEGCLPEDVFDKKPVIDAINQLKEIVGFNFWIDEEGGARFELPNWYTPGNRIMDDATHTTFVPDVDEATNLIEYSIDYTDGPVRSEIIIASADPNEHFTDTKTARLTVSDMAPESTELLRGMVKPAMWVNETFQNQKELDVMAKRVATQILFNQRPGHVTCAFNPAIQINDQVQIFERQTAETYVHYVRGIHITHDLESGKMNMTLTTHWLGTGSNFIIDTWKTP